jgi:O-antigen ligase
MPRLHAEPILESIVLYGSFGALLLGPLAFGAVEPWSTFMIQVLAALLFVLWAIQQVRLGTLRVAAHPLFAPMGLFGLIVLAQLAFRITAYPQATQTEMLLYATYGLLCFLIVQTLRRSTQAKRLAVAISVYATGLAAFALVQGLAPNGRLYWVRKPALGGWIYGPYVNHNHYAGLMELLLPVPLVLSLTHYGDSRRRLLAAAAAALIATTIFLSGSRGGMLAFVVQMVMFGVFLVRRRMGVRTASGVGVFLAIMLGLLAWIGGGEVTQRLASIHSEAHTELEGGTRWQINRDGLKMARQKPVSGWGLGTFPEVYPEFRTFYTNFFVNEAHDDYLQLLVETGLLGFGAMLWFLLVLYRRALAKLENWSSDLNGAVALATLLGVTGILVHSFVDFNLQIPANAALFYVWCTIAALEPRFSASRRQRHATRQNGERAPALP